MSTFEEEYESVWKYCDYSLDSELIVLKGHLVSERYIERFIKLFLLKGERMLSNGRLSYAQKLHLVDSFGIIDSNLISCLRKLNDLRNKLAHRLDYEICIDDIQFIGAPLGKTYTKFKKEHGDNLKNLMCTVIGFTCSGIAHYVVTYEEVSEKKCNELVNSNKEN